MSLGNALMKTRTDFAQARKERECRYRYKELSIAFSFPWNLGSAIEREKRKTKWKRWRARTKIPTGLQTKFLKDTAMNPRELSFQQLFFFHFLYVLLEDLGFSTCHSLYRFGDPFLPLTVCQTKRL